MGTERQAPEAILSSSNLSGVVGDIDEDPDAPDGNWMLASGNNVNTDVRTSFPTPTGDPKIGTDLQEFRAYVRQFDTGQTGDPDCRLELWDGGTLVRAGSNVSITGAGQVIALLWNANELTGPADGSTVEAKLVGTKSGGAPGARNSVDMGAVEWNVDFVTDIIVTPAAAVADMGAIAPPVVLGSITLTPAAAVADMGAVAPTVVLGSMTVAPLAAVVDMGAVAPTILNFITLTPAAAVADMGAVAPTVVLGSMSFTPAASVADMGAIAPTVVLGSITFTPAASVADMGAVAPTVVLGSITFTPAASVADMGAVAPTVVLGSTLTPAASVADMGAIAPTVVLGSMSFTPAAAVADMGAIAPYISRNVRKLVLENLPAWIAEISDFKLVSIDVRSREKAPTEGDKCLIWNGDDLEGKILATSAGHARRFETLIRVSAAEHANALELRNEDLADLVIQKILDKIPDLYALDPHVYLDDLKVGALILDRERVQGQLTITMECH